MITKTERSELKAIVRQQFRVLRAEVEQREAEVVADAEEQINGKYADEDAAWAEAARLAFEAVEVANRAVNDAYRELMGDEFVEAGYVTGRVPPRPQRHRVALRQEAVAKIGAQVAGALLQLQRQEADLLRTLAVGALDSSEAHDFLGAIPTVGQLVPTARFAELEASLETEGPNPDPFGFIRG
jgi:hypothetical protein